MLRILRQSFSSAAFILLCGLAFAAETAAPPLERAHQLRLSQRFEEAKQIYSDWLATHSDDGNACFELGYTIYLQACAESDPATATALRRKAWELGAKAERLKSDSVLLPSLLALTDANGTDLQASYSPKPAVNDLIKRAEAAFAKGQMDEALSDYQAALAIDPLAYNAAVFSGDVYFSRNDYGHAIEWFAKAVTINPDLELAHRYWGDALMKQGRTDEALVRYIDAVIAEPYNRISRTMLSRFVQTQKLTPPKREMRLPPMKVALENGQVSVAWDEKSGPLGMAYATARAKWLVDDRGKYFPKDAKPRHSLPEEVYALETFITVAGELAPKNPDQVEPWLATLDTLKTLKAEGLLSAFVLLDRADGEIVRDYAAYRMEHRAELARYISVMWLGIGKSGTPTHPKTIP